jgi:hypothetical protein
LIRKVLENGIKSLKEYTISPTLSCFIRQNIVDKDGITIWINQY